MTLIIRDQLVNPPTWFASFRDLTLYYSVFIKDDVILESDDPDIYVRWLRSRGGMDFIKDIISIGTEDGIRLDIEYNYPRSIVVDRISPENIHMLINRLKSLR